MWNRTRVVIGVTLLSSIFSMYLTNHKYNIFTSTSFILSSGPLYLYIYIWYKTSFHSKILRHIWQRVSKFPANANIELVYNIYVNIHALHLYYIVVIYSFARLHIAIVSSKWMNGNHVDDSDKADINLKCDNRGSIDCDLWYTRIIYRFIIISNLEVYLFFPFLNTKHVSLHLQLYSDLRHERAREKKLSRMLRCIALSLNPPVSPCRGNFSVERRRKKTQCTSSFDFFAHKQAPKLAESLSACLLRISVTQIFLTLPCEYDKT